MFECIPIPEIKEQDDTGRQGNVELTQCAKKWA